MIVYLQREFTFSITNLYNLNFIRMKKIILFIVGFLYICPLFAQDAQEDVLSTDVSLESSANLNPESDIMPAAITQVFIQNETISTNTNFDADIITLGSNVTTLKPSGDVIISGCTVNMTASEYVLQPTFSISSNSTISLTIK